MIPLLQFLKSKLCIRAFLLVLERAFSLFLKPILQTYLSVLYVSCSISTCSISLAAYLAMCSRQPPEPPPIWLIASHPNLSTNNTNKSQQSTGISKQNKSLYENVQPSARNKLCTNIEFNNPKLNHQYSNFEMFLHMFSSFSVPTVNVI